MERRSKPTPEEAIMLADPREVNIWLNSVTFRPLLSRSQWEQLPRRRRLVDRLLFRQPPKGFGDDDLL
ncbi:MAG: hypothetical protein ACJ76L_08400 [Conexibacter sp.]